MRSDLHPSLARLSTSTLGLALVGSLAGCTGGAAETDPVVFTGTGTGTGTESSDASSGSDGSSSSTSDSSAGSETMTAGTTEATSTTTTTTTGESETATDGSCVAGETMPCYSGPKDTQDVGECRSGVQTCGDDGAWGGCEGEVVPSSEVCGNELDDDCNGDVDDDIDADKDGWTTCGGDCCDVAGGVCQNPELVNPGAYEYVGNDVDDNCDGVVDEVATTCDDGLPSDAQDPLEYAKAMELCQFTIEAPADPEDRIWGVIDAKLTLADGKGAPKAAQRSIRPKFGNAISKKAGSQMAVFSSGHAASTGDSSPSFASFQTGVNHNTSSSAPADWVAANGGKLPNPPGCQAPGQLSANDPIMLTLRVRAPTNAKSFSVKMFFFSAEYPEWVCSEYNDFFVALVDSESEDNPADKNIAIYDDGDEQWPVGVNLVKVADGLFTACQNGTVGCQEKGIPASSYDGCTDPQLLLGTGFDDPDGAGCGSGKPIGGGTGWLTMDGNVSPGEIFELRLAVWDSGGHLFDSLVLLDDWQWSIDPAQPGLQPQ